MDVLLRSLLSLSEKSGQLARLFRQYKNLPIEEKEGESKNKRFSVDYKSLADVLIQELFKHFISQQFPKLSEFIFGEESNQFTNTHGETFTLSIGPTIEDTAHMLSRLLADRPHCLTIAKTIHDEIQIDNISSDVMEKLKKIDFDALKLGIWIDPLDGTNEYVKGLTGCHDNGIYSHGLQCATILVGVFNRETGEPIMGVVNQPFNDIDSEKVWHGRSIYGVAMKDCYIYHNTQLSGYVTPRTPHKVCLTSRSEDQQLVHKLSSKWEVLPVAGCGYKLLCVIDGLADVFILSRPSSYKWDTCGPQAILRAMGGNVVSFKTDKELLYNELEGGERGGKGGGEGGGDKWCNSDGIIAYRSSDAYTSLRGSLNKQ